jgi:hypothetical protein
MRNILSFTTGNRFAETATIPTEKAAENSDSKFGFIVSQRQTEGGKPTQASIFSFFVDVLEVQSAEDNHRHGRWVRRKTISHYL